MLTSVEGSDCRSCSFRLLQSQLPSRKCRLAFGNCCRPLHSRLFLWCIPCIIHRSSRPKAYDLARMLHLRCRWYHSNCWSNHCYALCRPPHRWHRRRLLDHDHPHLSSRIGASQDPRQDHKLATTLQCPWSDFRNVDRLRLLHDLDTHWKQQRMAHPSGLSIGSSHFPGWLDHVLSGVSQVGDIFYSGVHVLLISIQMALCTRSG